MLDLGNDVRVSVSQDARILAKTLPREGIAATLVAISTWAEDVAFCECRIGTFADPEAQDAVEIAIDLVADADEDAASKLWDVLAARLDDEIRRLPAPVEDVINAHVGVHVFSCARAVDDAASL